MNRLALVVGNSNYRHNPLGNPMNDANDIASVLEKLDFDVTKVLDATLTDLQQSINDFLLALDEYSVGLFYYAGHGMQIDGINYIVPVDLTMCDKGKTVVSCFPIQSLLDGTGAYKGKTVICILDACRTNPFTTRGWITAGFAPFANLPNGTIVAYSTSADCGAYDGHGSNGLYTQVLKEAMLIPNLKIEDMFKSVRKTVSEISSSQYDSEQLSWEYSSLVGDFYFSVTSQPVNAIVSDEEICQYISKRQEEYEAKTEDINDIECMAYVDAYNEFHIPIIRLLRAYSRIQHKRNGQHFSDATIDQLNINYLTAWGFYRKHERWYYKGHYVEMGDLLPLPEELKPKEPVDGEELEIEAFITGEILDGKIRFQLSSNIPKETPLIFSLDGKKYSAQSKVVVENEVLYSGEFSYHGRSIPKGFYTITVTCPINEVLPVSVRQLFGERSRNIIGRNVKYDPIGGNTINIMYGLLIDGDRVKMIDMRQSIS